MQPLSVFGKSIVHSKGGGACAGMRCGMVFTEIAVSVNKKKVLDFLNCYEDSSLYEDIAEEYEAIREKVFAVIRPRAAAAIGEERAWVLLTLGDGVSELIKALFDAGGYMGGMLADAIADQSLFSADRSVAEQLRTVCADRKIGVVRRYDAPGNMPMEKQAEILARTEGERLLGVGITSGLMFDPVKSMGYILELTDDPTIYRAEHDCSRCNAQNCGMRTCAYAE